MTPPVVRGILETPLYVEDLEASQSFYERVIGCTGVVFEGGRLHALRVPGGDILLLFKRGASTKPSDTPGGRIPPHDGSGQNHIAFEMQLEDMDTWRQHLRTLDIPVESEVHWPTKGHSIYFRDPDGHLIELVTRDTWDK
jgi:catechol 2,3-dioxygenase-like lactoylglutathione lyase family enzyme